MRVSVVNVGREKLNCRCRRAENGGEELQGKGADDPQNKRPMEWSGGILENWRSLKLKCRCQAPKLRLSSKSAVCLWKSG